jgi:apolipoprotein N-acyltransferase
MTEAQARTTANVVLAAAAIGAAYYVLKTPPLRRKVWQMARSWAAGPLVAWTAMEIRRAWEMSGSTAARPGSSAVSAAGRGLLPAGEMGRASELKEYAETKAIR